MSLWRCPTARPAGAPHTPHLRPACLGGGARRGARWHPLLARGHTAPAAPRPGPGKQVQPGPARPGGQGGRQNPTHPWARGCAPRAHREPQTEKRGTRTSPTASIPAALAIWLVRGTESTSLGQSSLNVNVLEVSVITDLQKMFRVILIMLLGKMPQIKSFRWLFRPRGPQL